MGSFPLFGSIPAGRGTPLAHLALLSALLVTTQSLAKSDPTPSSTTPLHVEDAAPASPPASPAASGLIDVQESRKALGKKSSTHYTVSPDPTRPGAMAALNATFFGKDRSILSLRAGTTDLLDGEADFYWDGLRVWSSKAQWGSDGSFEFDAGLPPITMRIPLAAVPVGPLMIKIDAGISAEADLKAKFKPELSIPIQLTSLYAEFSPSAQAAGFIEGYAQFIALRGGIGGEVELVDANASLTGRVFVSGATPQVDYSGYASFLDGSFYAFLDYFNIFAFRWTRAFKPKLFDWKGKCFSFEKPGDTDPCAAATHLH